MSKFFFKSKEYVCYNALVYLIDHFFLLSKLHKLHINNKKLLLNLKKNLSKTDDKGFFIKVSYANNNLIGGRLFSTKSFSLQKIEKRLRGALVNNLYHDIDMVNAQFNILLYYCNKKKIECYYLKDYVDHRDAIFEKYFSKTDLKKHEFKQNFCVALFFGVRLKKRKVFLKDKQFSFFFESFKKEIINIFNKLIVFEKELYYSHYTKHNKKNKKSSFFATFLQNIEKNILLDVVEITKDLLFIKINCFVLIHDGFMIPKFLLNNTLNIEKVIFEVNKKIYKKYDYPFTFIEKPFDISLIVKESKIFSEQDAEKLKILNKFSTNKNKILRGKVLNFILENIAYNSNDEKSFYTIKNLEWLVQLIVSFKVKSTDIRYCLKNLSGFKEPKVIKIDGVKISRYFLFIKSTTKKNLYMFEQIKNKNNLTDLQKKEVIDSLKKLDGIF